MIVYIAVLIKRKKSEGKTFRLKNHLTKVKLTERYRKTTTNME